MDLYLEISFMVAIIICCILNTIVCCTWLNGIFRNPEATKFSLMPVIVSCGTSELAISVMIARLVIKHLFG